MITAVGTYSRYRGMVPHVTSNEFRPAYAYVMFGIIAIAVLAIVFSGRVAGVSAGVALLGLAVARMSDKTGSAIAARSKQFDAALLAVLGAGIILLTLTADNI